MRNMMIKAKDWLAYDKKEKFMLLFGMRMYSLGANIRRTLKVGEANGKQTLDHQRNSIH